MSASDKFATARPLDPAHTELQGQARVNAEIFTAVEILGRKLQRSETERDRLTQRLALIESAATVDEKTGKLYLPVVMDPAMPPQASSVYATPKWMVTASLMSSAIALFALGLVLFRDPVSPLTKEQLAVLNSLQGPQFASLAPDNKGWKYLGTEQLETPATVASQMPKPATPPIPPQQAAGPKLPDAAELAKLEKTAQPPKPVEVVVVKPMPLPKPPVTVAEKSGIVKTAEAKLEKISLPPEITTVRKTAEKAAPVPAVAVVPAAPKVAEKKPEPAAVSTPVVAPKVATVAAPPAAVTPVPPPVAAPPVAASPVAATTPTTATPVAATPAVAENIPAPAPDTTLPAKLADLEKRAYQGIPEAQHDLATLYASGKLVAQNYPRAIYWFTKAADGGVANAHYNLGVIYHQGLGVTADMPKALSWYEKAAELGHPEAMYNLGIAYIEGVGTKTDIEKGVSYFKRAAKAGVAQAAYNLGVLYESNFIGPIDKDKAIEWYQMAANEGHTAAQEAITRMKAPAVATNDQALTLADMVEPAAGTKTVPGSPPQADDSSKPPPLQDAQKKLVAAIQQALIRQGLLPGTADGVMTPQTEDAIRVYQKKVGLMDDGMPSQILLDKVLQTVPAPVQAPAKAPAAK